LERFLWADLSLSLPQERLSTSGIEVFEIFWHPYELLQSYDSWDEDADIVLLLTQFLVEAGSDVNVSLSSVYSAAMDWAQNAES
jgi:hypothetical protein